MPGCGSGELPQTSLPAAQDISDAFDAIAAAGYDGVIALMLSAAYPAPTTWCGCWRRSGGT